jgi:Domain of unknown function (DUF4396)
MAPVWLTVVAWLYLSACFCCAGIIAYDIAFNRRRQPMGVMNFVFPITALYFGPFALALYWRWGRAAARTAMASMPMSRAAVSPAAAAPAGGGMRVHGGQNADHEMAAAAGPDGADEPALPGERARPWWVTMAIEVSHCGSGCTLGDVIAEFAVFGLGLTIAGLALGAEYVGDFVFSLTAFEVGLFGWMAVMAFVLFPAPHHLMPSSAAYWLLMQAGMIIGYFTSWPANVWLVKRGIKVPM